MLIQNQNFNIKQIADSGQCFRMNRVEGKDSQLTYGVVAYGKYLEITQQSDDIIELSCSVEEYEQLWKDYFDMSYDYGKVVDSLINGEDQFLKEAAQYGRGIRILKQEPFEATISFIISQNKNIPAIKSCIEGICRSYGEKKINRECGDVVYYTFPSPEKLASAEKEDLRALKTGYRDAYIIRASQAISSGEVDLNRLCNLSFDEAIQELRGIHGVGEKVANCIALYGMHHIEGFPVDVWILKVLKDIYHNNFDKMKYHGYAGIIQQYMFYYIRHLSLNAAD